MARPTRICVLFAFALFALLASAGASVADVVPSVSPDVLRGPGPWSVTYRIEFDAGAADEHHGFSVFGSGLEIADPVVAGPGTLTSAGRQLIGGSATCESHFGFLDPGIATGAAYDLDLPAGTQTTLTVGVVASHPFALGDTAIPGLNISVDGKPLDFQGPALAVPRLVPIKLRIAAKAVAPGARAVIRGHTSPLLAGSMLALRAAYAPLAKYVDKPAFRTRIARVRVSRNGSFSYHRWRPRRAGRWAVSAFYRSHDPRFVDSATSGCFPAVQVRRLH